MFEGHLNSPSAHTVSEMLLWYKYIRWEYFYPGAQSPLGQSCPSSGWQTAVRGALFVLQRDRQLSPVHDSCSVRRSCFEVSAALLQALQTQPMLAIVAHDLLVKILQLQA